jgi:uncharacterized SAM-binding protein YcdF (DUF218 family)
VIVVLGGHVAPRAARAARLHRQGLAPRILFTGRDDCEEAREVLTRSGVPLRAVEYECEAASTFENAARATRLIRERGETRVIVVTHWYHSRRALAAFRRAAPEMRILAASTRVPGAAWRADLHSIVTEYLKIVWYAIRHRAAGPPDAAPAGGGV